MVIIMDNTDMSDCPKEKDRVRSSFSVDFSGQSLEDDGTNSRNSKKHKGSHTVSIPVVGSGLNHKPSGEHEVHSEPSSPAGVRSPTEPSSPVRVRSGFSYKDSLVGMIPGAYESAFFGNNMEEDGGGICSDEDEDDEPPEDGEVVIKFPRELKQKIRAPWCSSLIVKVFGRSVGYVFLVNKLKSMWKALGNFSCVDLGLGFFLIKFDSMAGFEEVLKGGPWFIGEHFLSLRPWVPNFRASEASVSSIAVWVRLPELPVEYYHKESLLRIGSGLGPMLRVDFNTASGIRGRFVRICIQIDLEKPLVRTIRVDKTRMAVIYEGPAIGIATPARTMGNEGQRRGVSGSEVSAVQSRVLSSPRFKYSPLEKGKKQQTNGPNDTEPSKFIDPINSEGPITSSSGPCLENSNLQSIPLDHCNPLKTYPTGSSPFQLPPSISTSSISLCPQAPYHNPKICHDNHSLGFDSNPQRSSKLDDSAQGTEYSDHRRYHRVDSKGPSPCVGLVRRRDSLSMSKDCSGSQSQRLSRSPSPNRNGLVAGN
uniref:DUF4283 domain-containing protein n=1 Tax=Fagus sylvatica TaxID=28930 RepID=A0A2N9EGI5_FAGSY